MAMLSSIQIHPRPPAAGVNAVAVARPVPWRGPVHMEEARAFAQIDVKGDVNDTLRYLDTWATNHMSGTRAVFSEIDDNVYGTMMFGDGSVVNIEGRGMILFACKTCEHRELTDVCYIPRLDTNLISICQLDDNGYDIHIEHGVMRICDEQRRLLARMWRSLNCPYNHPPPQLHVPCV